MKNFFSAILLVSIPAVSNAATFSIDYFDYGVGFDDPIYGTERQKAFERAAYIFGSTALQNYQGDIQLGVSGTLTGGLAAASPNIPFDPDGGGFGRPNVVRTKLLTGGEIDLNGNDYDSFIDVNFDEIDWQLGLNSPNDFDQYDFYSTMFHEFTHSLGFLSTIDLETGSNLAGDGLAGSGRPGDWTVFDSFITDGDSRYLIDPVTFENTQSERFQDLATNAYEWDATGLFFYGENAVEANGGYLVPLFTPPDLDYGSSVSHTDEYSYGLDMMTPYEDVGTGIRTYSDVEIGILKDIGYTNISNIDISIVPVPASLPLLLGGLGLLGGAARLRKRPS